MDLPKFQGAPMSWDNWSEFWSMGGDGLYVWAAYLVALVVTVTEVVVLRLSRHSILEHLGRYARPRTAERLMESDQRRP